MLLLRVHLPQVIRSIPQLSFLICDVSRKLPFEIENCKIPLRDPDADLPENLAKLYILYRVNLKVRRRLADDF